MNDKKKFLIIMLIFVLLIAGALALYNSLGKSVDTQQIILHETPESEEIAASEPPSAQATSQPEPEPILAPDVHIYDRDGNEAHLSQYFGKPLVLNFWASWCGPCQSEMPDFQAKYNELGGEVNFLMVNMTDGARETVETASAFIDKNGFDFPVFYDTTSEAALTYEAYSLPTTYFINAQGHIIAQAVGAIDGDILQQGIDLIRA